MKKRLNKSEKKVIEKLADDQLNVLNSLRGRVKLMQERISELESKIASEGIATNYSSSSDILRIAQEIYAMELRLSTLKLMQMDLEFSFRKG